MIDRTLLVFPNQLFAVHPGLDQYPQNVVLVEEPLFFADTRYPASFHKQKLWFHRASMSRYRSKLEAEGHSVTIEAYNADTRMLEKLLARIADEGSQEILCCDPVDYSLKKRLETACEAAGVVLNLLHNPGFLNTAQDNASWSYGRKRWFMAEFYKFQRRRLGVLMDGDRPTGGQWSYDEDNRKKVPAKLLASIPRLPSLKLDDCDIEARDSVLAEFPDNYGSLEQLIYPTSHGAAEAWLCVFLEERFAQFGDYEDAIVRGESWLWHGILTPMLNTGLLTPQQVLEAALAHGESHGVPLNSLEGFVRQIIGWREFMRATYEDLGVQMRTTNHWNHERGMPACFYDGTTGIDPVDDVIRRVLDTGYCHHIERLMVLGGFMFLCEINPDDVYRWFMEMFVDSYDWVMVPNAYAMSQHADGGLITTKPYFSGSNYIKKMSNWKDGDWARTWDGLYWRFIWKHREALAGNPRWAMMCRTAEKMDPAKREAHLSNAAIFLRNLR